MTKPTAPPTKPTPPASAIYVALVLPGREPIQTGVDLDNPQWERILTDIIADIRLDAFRFLLAEARKPVTAEAAPPAPPAAAE